MRDAYFEREGLHAADTPKRRDTAGRAAETQAHKHLHVAGQPIWLDGTDGVAHCLRRYI